MQKGSKVCVNLHEHWKSYEYSTFDAVIIDVLEGGWYRLKVKNHDTVCQVPFYRLSPRRPKETKTHWEPGQEVQVYEPDNQGWWDATIVRYDKGRKRYIVRWKGTYDGYPATSSVEFRRIRSNSMGSFYRVIPPFSTYYIDRIYLFDDQVVSALHFAKILGYKSVAGNVIQKFAFEGESRSIPGGHPVKLFVAIQDMSKILAELDRNPRDVKTLFNWENKVQTSEEDDRNLRKRDREEKDCAPQEQNLSDDLIKLFAKRYITENPQKIREVIFERLIGQNVEEFIKKI